MKLFKEEKFDSLLKILSTASTPLSLHMYGLVHCQRMCAGEWLSIVAYHTMTRFMTSGDVTQSCFCPHTSDPRLALRKRLQQKWKQSAGVKLHIKYSMCILRPQKVKQPR